MTGRDGRLLGSRVDICTDGRRIGSAGNIAAGELSSGENDRVSSEPRSFTELQSRNKNEET
jgi:hypothetical protein